MEERYTIEFLKQEEHIQNYISSLEKGEERNIIK
jgi:hypothetical protein